MLAAKQQRIAAQWKQKT